MRRETRKRIDPKGRQLVAPPVRAGIMDQTIVRREAPKRLARRPYVAPSALRIRIRVANHTLTDVAITCRLFEARLRTKFIVVMRSGRLSESHVRQDHSTKNFMSQMETLLW